MKGEVRVLIVGSILLIIGIISIAYSIGIASNETGENSTFASSMKEVVVGLATLYGGIFGMFVGGGMVALSIYLLKK